MNKDFSSKDIIHIKHGDLEYLKFKALEKYSDKISHIITLRHGGVSSFPQDTLNFRTAGTDTLENVSKNLDIVCKELGISKDNIYKGRQSHTDNILVINELNKSKYSFFKLSDEEIDGYVCNEKNIATLVTTADCNPIIIYDFKKNIYANVHSGWKGTLKQIYLKAAKLMNEKFSCNFKDMIVCVGPSIKKCCFSSEDEDFKKKFTSIWKDEKEYIYYEKNSNRFHIDLSFVIKKDLTNLGIKEENIVIPNICTKCNCDMFFSYREATSKGYEDYGTMATIVTLI